MNYNCEICGWKKSFCKNCREFFIPIVKPIDVRDIDDLVAPYEYASLLRECILNFKFKDKKYLKFALSELLAESFVKERLYREYGAITFVPMARREKSLRGFNQSELIAKEIADLCDLKFMDIFKKVKETKPQSSLEPHLRLLNLRGAFTCERIRGNILIVDDVITTGSTITELGRIAKENGAKKVGALILARTPY